MRDAVPSCGAIGGAGRRVGARGNCRHAKKRTPRRRTPVPARRPGGSPPPSSGLVVAGALARWCGWGSWGVPGRGRVRICCKGVSRQDRPREEARNINDSLPASRRDPGLCNRFGQPAPPRAPRVGPSLAGWRPRRAPRRASTSLNPRERLLEVRARGLGDVLGGYPAISRAGSGRTGTVGWRWESRKGVGNGAAPGGVAHGGLESRKGVRNGEATGRRERGR